MLINKNISEYLIFEFDSISNALKKISLNKRRIIFLVSENGVLKGVLTDGDFRRWITKNSVFDLNQEVSLIANKNVLSARIDDERAIIEAKFTDAVDIIPLKDNSSRFVAVAIRGLKGFSIGNASISESSRSFIIAEIGNNHNGDISLAKKLVDLAHSSGADCAKFQMRDLNSLYQHKNASADLGSEYTFDLLRKFQLSNDELIDVFDYCKSKGLPPLCTPWDFSSLALLEEYGMEAYKVASADFTNHALLEALVKTGKPLICSTGMSAEFEIKQTVRFLNERSANFALLHCNSTYPTPYKDVNLQYLDRLKKITSGPIGYSGHERGASIPIAAVALGAKIIEKHFTIDKTMEGNDHKVSLLPEEFKMMVKDIRNVEKALTGDGERSITQGELLNRETLAKSIVAKTYISKGDLLTRKLFEIKSPGEGLQPMYLEKLLGKTAKRNFEVGDFFYESDLVNDEIRAKKYNFSRPFGIPVRYHDYASLVAKSNFDFVEFHLSYNDMELVLDDYFKEEQKINFAVHCPELFAGDHIMDLSSKTDSYRKRSILELQKVCEITRELKKKFPRTNKPVIVINAGGFSRTDFLPKHLIKKMYATVANSLKQIDQKGVEIIVQTMPPFPWHFGGQSHHNLFVDPYEIKQFCTKYGYRICYDVSHSMMAANYYGWDLKKFTELVAPYVAHMHIVDALGVDGEGVEMGKGDVKFDLLTKQLNAQAKNIMFLPEVWQGHKNQGEGFWKALEYLERVKF
tara:strand:- start:32630 stop:34867 length:2238 start_codon:yes stop_codon:yes gene_type:complete